MERDGLARIGELKLPIGFRFRPTDEELIVHYLRRKVFSLPLPANVIPEFDVFRTDPWKLPGDFKEKYFFRKGEGNSVRRPPSRRMCGSGYWRSVGKEKRVSISNTNEAIGMKRTLAFHNGKKRPNGSLRRWFMDECSVLGSELSSNQTPQGVEMGDWLVYRVYQKKRKRKCQGIDPVNIDPTAVNVSASPSCSSEITEASDHGEIGGGSLTSFPSFSCMKKD